MGPDADEHRVPPREARRAVRPPHLQGPERHPGRSLRADRQDTTRSMTRRAALKEALVVAAGSIVAACAYTWPLIAHVQSRVSDKVDTLFQTWTIDWVQYGLEHGRNIYNANIFVPNKTTLAYSDTLLGVAIPAFPLRWLGF